MPIHIAQDQEWVSPALRLEVKRVTSTDMRATDSFRRESLKSPLGSPSILPSGSHQAIC